MFAADAPAAQLELEWAIVEHFGLTISVIVLAGPTWPTYVQRNPFPDVAHAAPNYVLLALSKAPPRAAAVAALRERATAGEAIVQVDDGLWIHYPAGAGTPRLSPAVFDRLVGSPVTARNWRTVLKLAELCGYTL